MYIYNCHYFHKPWQLSVFSEEVREVVKGGSALIQWKLDLADTDLAENLDLKNTPQKIWATVFDFYYRRIS